MHFQIKQRKTFFGGQGDGITKYPELDNLNQESDTLTLVEWGTMHSCDNMMLTQRIHMY